MTLFILPLKITASCTVGNEAPNRNICITAHHPFLKQHLCQAPNAQCHITHHSDFQEQLVEKAFAGRPLTVHKKVTYNQWLNLTLSAASLFDATDSK
ncbi:MAG: hypothetical protein NTY00_06245 [Deltaproteobacteria bacterium]|nr:hypothetical protein [Deltaproteobacteria bacterium]